MRGLTLKHADTRHTAAAFMSWSCGVQPPAFATLGMQSAFNTAVQASSCICTSLASADARIAFRTFPSGATFALTHTNLDADEHDDAARLGAIYEAFVVRGSICLEPNEALNMSMDGVAVRVGRRGNGGRVQV